MAVWDSLHGIRNMIQWHCVIAYTPPLIDLSTRWHDCLLGVGLLGRSNMIQWHCMIAYTPPLTELCTRWHGGVWQCWTAWQGRVGVCQEQPDTVTLWPDCKSVWLTLNDKMTHQPGSTCPIEHEVAADCMVKGCCDANSLYFGRGGTTSQKNDWEVTIVDTFLAGFYFCCIIWALLCSFVTESKEKGSIGELFAFVCNLLQIETICWNIWTIPLKLWEDKLESM